MNINVEDAEAFFKHVLHLISYFMAFKDGEVRVHFQYNIQIDIATIGPATLGLDACDFGNLQNGTLVIV